MAVKVMIAPAIVRGEVARSAEAPAAPKAQVAPREAAKPRRRKSAVYDADGNEVFITLMCLKCHKMRPLAQFGLRKMADGAIRNQPWCRPCRSGTGAERAKGRGEAAVSEGSPEAAAPTLTAPGGSAPTPAPASPNLAAQIAAALYRGRG